MSTIGLQLGLLTVIISHVLFTQPFVILIVHARMLNFDRRLVESARDLGASPLTAFFTVTLPIIRPGCDWRGPDRHGAVDRRFRHHLLHHRQRQHLADAGLGNDPHRPDAAVNAIGTLILLLTIGSTIDRVAADALSRLKLWQWWIG